MLLGRIWLGILMISIWCFALLRLIEYFSSFFILEQFDSWYRESKINMKIFVIDYLHGFVVLWLFFLTCTLFIWREICIFFQIKKVWITRTIIIACVIFYTILLWFKIFKDEKGFDTDSWFLTNIRIIQSCVKTWGESYHNLYDRFPDTKSKRIVEERIKSKTEQELDLCLKRNPGFCPGEVGLTVMPTPSHTIACECPEWYYYWSVEEWCILYSKREVYVAEKSNIHGSNEYVFSIQTLMPLSEAQRKKLADNYRIESIVNAESELLWETNMYLFKGNFSDDESVKNIKTQIRKDPNILLVSWEE